METGVVSDRFTVPMLVSSSVSIELLFRKVDGPQKLVVGCDLLVTHQWGWPIEFSECIYKRVSLVKSSQKAEQ